MTEPIYVVITPVRNEAERVAKTIDSMVRQTLRPAAWVIVDDGSSDETPRIIDAAAQRHLWIRTVHRRDRGSRKSGGGVVEAFYDGYPIVADLPWDFLVKLDGDLSFSSDYFEHSLERFAGDPQLGIGGGTVCIVDGGEAKVESRGDPPFHVRGATKIYRRRCWEEIGPLVQAPGWDTIDEVKANMRGWSTRTFPDLHIIQHKSTGSADGAWRNWFKNGRGCYISGYDPLFMLAKCLRRTFRRPPLLPAVALGAGFCSGYFSRSPRLADRAVVRYLRRQQRQRLLLKRSIYGD
jgi:glycosyltransferase involved in cell wall biosynthesis